MFRRKFESVTHRTGADPATFATELEILAVRGFGDMGTCARNRMVRDRFIADQRNCPRHGVNRCSRVDTSFSFLPRGWSVDIRDGQYRAVWPGGSMVRSPPGNEGWSASRIIGDQGTIDPGGGEHASPVNRSQPIWGSPVG